MALSCLSTKTLLLKSDFLPSQVNIKLSVRQHSLSRKSLEQCLFDQSLLLRYQVVMMRKSDNKTNWAILFLAAALTTAYASNSAQAQYAFETLHQNLGYMTQYRNDFSATKSTPVQEIFLHNSGSEPSNYSGNNSDNKKKPVPYPDAPTTDNPKIDPSKDVGGGSKTASGSEGGSGAGSNKTRGKSYPTRPGGPPVKHQGGNIPIGPRL